LRQKIGVVFGNPEVTTGGNALKFYASVRLDIRRIGQIKEADQVVGSRARVKVVKNKVAPPFREAEFEVRYGSGINTMGELVDLAAAHGLLEKSGAWYVLDGERIGQGRDRACELLAEQPEVAQALRERLVTALRSDARPAAQPAKPEEEAAGAGEAAA
jgi:recombination protein RecA